MIESFNNVIFYTGYFCISGLFLWIGFSLYLRCYEVLMNRKWFFKLIFDSALIKSFKNTSDENFEKWIERMREKYKDSKQKENL
jgi:hypothetical protein